MESYNFRYIVDTQYNHKYYIFENGPADDEAPATEEKGNDWEDKLLTDFFLTEKPFSAVENDETDEDDKPECQAKTAGDAFKWMCFLKHYFLNSLKTLIQQFN